MTLKDNCAYTHIHTHTHRYQFVRQCIHDESTTIVTLQQQPTNATK